MRITFSNLPPANKDLMKNEETGRGSEEVSTAWIIDTGHWKCVLSTSASPWPECTKSVIMKEWSLSLRLNERCHYPWAREPTWFVGAQDTLLGPWHFKSWVWRQRPAFRWLHTEQSCSDGGWLLRTATANTNVTHSQPGCTGCKSTSQASYSHLAKTCH